MTLSVNLPDAVQARLDAKARAAGLDVTAYAQPVLQADAALPALDDILRPVRDAVKNSGMTEDELTQMLEKAKHDMRADRRGRQSNDTPG
jgi:hypothetical protein